MATTLLIVISIAVGIRVLPILDSLVELVNHYIAIQIQKCEIKLRDITLSQPPD